MTTYVTRASLLAAGALSLALSSQALTSQALAAGDFATPMSNPKAIAGTMNIQFQTRIEKDKTGNVPAGSAALGVVDTYTTDLSVLDSVVFQGRILRQPWLPTTTLGRTAQTGFLAYELKAILKNPANPTQTRTLGNLVGATSLDGQGKYTLDAAPEGKGPLRIATDSIGNITGFTSPFTGVMEGRVPEQAGLWGMASRASKKVNKEYSRLVDGKVIKHSVAGAEPMQFAGIQLGQGPLAAYPATRVTGSIDYDAEQSIWYVDVGASYTYEGAALKDRYSGTIRWVESPTRAKDGKGWYEMNIRINEKAATEGAVFASDSAAAAEDAFFAASTSVPGLGGKINYIDSMEDETVTESKITYEVTSEQASKIQVMNFAKILLLMVGPLNDE
jgi:hypothetical protein